MELELPQLESVACAYGGRVLADQAVDDVRKILIGGIWVVAAGIIVLLVAFRPENVGTKANAPEREIAVDSKGNAEQTSDKHGNSTHFSEGLFAVLVGGAPLFISFCGIMWFRGECCKLLSKLDDGS